jgi:uncharacterized protein (DUF983 family)
MALDTGKVFKRPVFCPHCYEDYLFALRAIAENTRLKCPSCGGAIDIANPGYDALVRDVKNILERLEHNPR